MEHSAYRIDRPCAERALPIVVDSPHSGSEDPAGFDTLLPRALLRRAEDAFVDRLWAGAPAHGATLLAARFPRAYIDPNRPLQGARPAVWREIEGLPLYARPLDEAQLQLRAERCWRPYHQALQHELEAALRRWGRRWHLDVHSMPDDCWRRMGQPGRVLADFVLGDRDGSSAGEEVVALIERALRDAGFSVARNAPFRGAEIVRVSGDPARGCHSVQVEVRRSLYMDEQRHELHAGFERVRAAAERVLAALAEHAARHLCPSGTDRAAVRGCDAHPYG